MNRLAKRFFMPALAGFLALAGSGCGEKRVPGFRTLNPGYSRLSSPVLVREIDIPTRAQLDGAAYSANALLWDAADTVRLPRAPGPKDLRFGGLLTELRASPEDLPLTRGERMAVMAWRPSLDFLLEQDFEAARPLAEAYGTVLAERWGFRGDAPPFAEFTELHLASRDSSVWVKLEWRPWARPAPASLRDVDGDGFVEIYGRVNPRLLTPALFARLAGDYSTRVLNEEEIVDYGRQLAALWYPSRNTDFQDLRGRGEWPGEDVEAGMKAALNGARIDQPLFALRGKPHGSPMYFVVRVPGLGGKRVENKGAPAASTAGRAVADNLGEYLSSIQDRETALLADAGRGSWQAWSARVAPFRSDVEARLKSQPASVNAFEGERGFLLFRRELEYLLAGDLQNLPRSRNPLETIVALRDSLAALGIDFLFVPIPTKQDVYPELVSRRGSTLPGGTAQPYFRKVLLDLSRRRVETVDLLSLFRDAGEDGLYQKQDTHWSPQGLQLAASALGERVMSYAWFGEAYPQEVRYATRDTAYAQLGDLHGRLPAARQAAFGPEPLRASRVLLPGGAPYADEASAPVLVLGDSYTGVFQLTGCRSAGVTAHLAKTLGGPVDLIMGWGGGPEAPNKLRRAGGEALQGKRLVIWMMSARDLFVYPEGWGG